ncbi:MAG: hypothetical protein ACPG5P_05340, partial [Saprospiraceae bacterium]
MSEQDNWSNRPIISITISYAVASWGVIQFIDWIVKRYLLNTLWTDAAVIMALVLIPSILFFSWIKSKKDVDGFKWEKWFYLGNLILAGIMIVSMFLLQGNPTIT